MNRAAVLVPLIVGMIATPCTIVIHGLAVLASLHFVRHERTRGRAGATFWIDLGDRRHDSEDRSGGAHLIEMGI